MQLLQEIDVQKKHALCRAQVAYEDGRRPQFEVRACLPYAPQRLALERTCVRSHDHEECEIAHMRICLENSADGDYCVGNL